MTKNKIYRGRIQGENQGKEKENERMTKSKAGKRNLTKYFEPKTKFNEMKTGFSLTDVVCDFSYSILSSITEIPVPACMSLLSFIRFFVPFL